jgi:hypothetical protein
LGLFVVLAFAILIFLVGDRRAFAQGNATSEYQVKAAFLFHFAQFVDWPAETFKEANSPLTYCTLGEDPFRGVLDSTLKGKSIGSRPVQVQHFKQAQEARGCQVLFIGAAGPKFISETLANFNGNPVLTVGETERFAQDGGVIGFTLADNKVRFEINLDVAEHAGLKISSKLLVLAKTVIGGPKGD